MHTQKDYQPHLGYIRATQQKTKHSVLLQLAVPLSTNSLECTLWTSSAALRFKKTVISAPLQSILNHPRFWKVDPYKRLSAEEPFSSIH